MSHVFIIQHPNAAMLRSFLSAPKGCRFETAFDGTVLRSVVPEGWRLPEETAATLENLQADFAVLPDLPFDSVGLIVSDMDSTLINIECIDEIAACAGLGGRLAEITERSMRGEIDFTQSLHERVAMLEGLPESILQTVYDEQLRTNAGARYLLEECRRHDVHFVLVSGGFTYFTERLKHDLGLYAAHANQLEINGGKLTGRVKGDIIDAAAKARLLEQYRTELPPERRIVLAVGDGANDIPMLQAASFGMAFHAKPKTVQAADIAIRFGNLYSLRRWFRP